jgi:streptomycin 6-kinase
MEIISILHESFLAATITLLSLYFLIGGAYRVYFSPISKFPGPKLAALTWWFVPLFAHAHTNEHLTLLGTNFTTISLSQAPKANMRK